MGKELALFGNSEFASTNYYIDDENKEFKILLSDLQAEPGNGCEEIQKLRFIM